MIGVETPPFSASGTLGTGDWGIMGQTWGTGVGGRWINLAGGASRLSPVNSFMLDRVEHAGNFELSAPSQFAPSLAGPRFALAHSRIPPSEHGERLPFLGLDASPSLSFLEDSGWRWLLLPQRPDISFRRLPMGTRVTCAVAGDGRRWEGCDAGECEGPGGGGGLRLGTRGRGWGGKGGA